MLAEIRAAEESLRARHGDRITRITVSPELMPWLRCKFPAAEAPLIPVLGASVSGIPIVTDSSFMPGRLRIHRGDTVEDWFAIPADNPERLIQFRAPEFPFPWMPR